MAHIAGHEFREFAIVQFGAVDVWGKTCFRNSAGRGAHPAGSSGSPPKEAQGSQGRGDGRRGRNDDPFQHGASSGNPFALREHLCHQASPHSTSQSLNAPLLCSSLATPVPRRAGQRPPHLPRPLASIVAQAHGERGRPLPGSAPGGRDSGPMTMRSCAAGARARPGPAAAAGRAAAPAERGGERGGMAAGRAAEGGHGPARRRIGGGGGPCSDVFRLLMSRNQSGKK